MPPPTTENPAFRLDPLSALIQEVISARAAMTAARRAPLGASNIVEVTRTRLLLALEAYTAELDARHLPVPYAIRDDLRIQRLTLGKPQAPPASRP
jgi:hypothetical protein